MTIPAAVWEGEFTVFGVTVRCAVLDDGERVINAEDTHRLMKAMARPESRSTPKADFEQFARWISGADQDVH